MECKSGDLHSEPIPLWRSSFTGSMTVQYLPGASWAPVGCWMNICWVPIGTVRQLGAGWMLGGCRMPVGYRLGASWVPVGYRLLLLGIGCVQLDKYSGAEQIQISAKLYEAI